MHFQLPAHFWLYAPIVIFVLLSVLIYEWHHIRTNPSHESKTAFGTANWANFRALKRAGLFATEGLILGRLAGKLLRLSTDRHLITLAPTRSGKGVSAIVPNLLTYEGSLLVIDPKGENAAIAVRRRRQLGQRVHILDPWGLVSPRTEAFNPLEFLHPESEDVAEDAHMIADSLVETAGKGQDSHWNSEAIGLLTGLILHVVTSERQELRHLPRVRELLTLAPEDFDHLLDAMVANKAAHGLVARAANRLIQKSDRERSSVISTAQAQTLFVDSPRMKRVLTKSDFDFQELKSQKTSVFLVLPAERIPTFNRWLRLLVGLSLTAMARLPGKPEKPVLFILDEFAALGHLETIETAMGLMAGYGVQLWPILQDLNQLKDLSQDRWQTFLANAGVVQAFNVNDQMTAEHLSNMLGTRTVTVQNLSAGRSDSRKSQVSNVGNSFTRTSWPLLMPDEITRLPPDMELLFIQGQAPAMARKVRYFADREFTGLFDRNPLRRQAQATVSPKPKPTVPKAA